MTNGHDDRDIRDDLIEAEEDLQPSEPDDGFDDRSLITPTRLAALRPTLRAPTTYTQRLVERLDFLPEGGQRWRRDLQVLIPALEGFDVDRDEWFVISLGQFRRRRLPDFSVTDCSGRVLNLLTRVQHGHCLAYITIDQFLFDPERNRIAGVTGEEAEAVRAAYSRLYVPTFEMFTSVREGLAEVAEQELVDLLSLLGAEAEPAKKRAKIFMEDMREVQEGTQYLCWVRARPGAPVRLTATYTMPDPARLPAPDPGVGTGRFARLRANARLWSSEVYAQLGLGPIFYGFRTPANDHAGSYYFTLEPPAETSIAYLDWGLDNTIEGDDEEWACAHNSVHVHNGAGLLGLHDEPKPRKEIPNSKIHAFMRLDPADHKQVLFAAILNLVFVWLAEAGRLSSQLDSTATPWLAFIPALLIAYVAQQRRHYFASSTRWIRGVIWAYLVLNITFLVSITFDIASDGSFADRNGFSDDAVSLVMAAGSIIVFCIFAFVGWPYEPAVKKFFRRARRRVEQSVSSQEPEDTDEREAEEPEDTDEREAEELGDTEELEAEEPDTVHTYARVARWYGHLAVATIAVLLGLMAALILTGKGPNPHSIPAPPRAEAGHKEPAVNRPGSESDPRSADEQPRMRASAARP